MRSIQTASRYVARGEFRTLLRGFQDWLPRRAFHRCGGVVFELRPGCPPHRGLLSTGLPANCHFEQLTGGALERQSEIRGPALSEVRRRRRHGDRCFGISANGRPLNVNWLHAGSCYVRGFGLSLPLADIDCYVYGVATDPEYRQKGFYAYAQQRLIRLLAAEGAGRILQLVEDGNEIPLKVLPRLGYEVRWVIRHVTFAGIQNTAILHPDGRRLARQVRVRAPSDVFRI